MVLRLMASLMVVVSTFVAMDMPVRAMLTMNGKKVFTVASSNFMLVVPAWPQFMIAFMRMLLSPPARFNLSRQRSFVVRPTMMRFLTPFIMRLTSSYVLACTLRPRVFNHCVGMMPAWPRCM
jgi:hypothetical protein